MKTSIRLAPVLSIFLALCSLGALLAGAVVGFIGLPGAHAAAGNAPELTWTDLRGLDYRTGQPTDKLKNLDGNLVRIPGFMIPLEDDERAVTEFLLVPYPLACIHVPAPPPNQIVHVKMDKGKKAAMNWYEPIWVQGRLEIKTVKNVYTEASYYLTGLTIEPYKYRRS
jgi:hypothetical protein